MCIAGACGLSAFQIVRCAVASPDVRVKKSERAMGVLEDKHFYKEGASFREHGLRRCAAFSQACNRENPHVVSHSAPPQLPAHPGPRDFCEPERASGRCVRVFRVAPRVPLC